MTPKPLPIFPELTFCRAQAQLTPFCRSFSRRSQAVLRRLARHLYSINHKQKSEIL